MTLTNRAGLLGGIALILLGLTFLLNNFGLVPDSLANLWPLFVIGGGIWLLARAARRRRGGGIVGGVLVLALGVFWLLNNYRVISDQYFMPIVVIALGLGLLVRAFVPR